ncbi:MAG: DUF1559 domain-containing protein, partial [Planctomycetales bacterium]|nr:DUF1559 domain-containing protein [Planctomycetales bacterium]
DDNEGYTVGWNEDTIRKTSDPPEPDHAEPGVDGEKLFGSSHPGGVNVVMADGSVQLVNYGIDGKVFHAMGNVADEKVAQQ